MNKELQEFARKEIKDGLARLPAAWQRKFKQMYSHENLEADINDVVDRMPEERLDWAMEQVKMSLRLKCQ
jgi:hypothetical protein